MGWVISRSYRVVATSADCTCVISGLAAAGDVYIGGYLEWNEANYVITTRRNTVRSEVTWADATINGRRLRYGLHEKICSGTEAYCMHLAYGYKSHINRHWLVTADWVERND